MELVTRTTKGRPVERNPRKADLPPTYPKGRVCRAKRVCGGKELSIYNEGPDCNQCRPARYRMLGSAEDLAELMGA